MKDFINIINSYQNITVADKPYAIATVIGIEGNSFRRSGLRMLITTDGKWIYEDVIGVLEDSVFAKIQSAFFANKSIIINIDTAKEGAEIGVALGYRGVIQLFINPKMDTHIQQLKTCLDEVDSQILITIVESFEGANTASGDMLIYKNDIQFFEKYGHIPFVEQLTDIAHQIWKRGRLDTPIIEQKSGQIKLFCEIITPQPTLVLFGSQYDIPPFVTIAKTIGWKVVLVAKPEKLRKSIASLADEVFGLEDMYQIKTNPYTAFILLSHLFDRDKNYLVQALKTNVPYIGILGPRRRFERMLTHLAAEGFNLNKEDKARLHAPMGLDLGATTQEEIAISTIAEVRAFFNNKQGGFLKNTEGDIHKR